MTPQEFKHLLLTSAPEDVLESCILSGEAKHVNESESSNIIAELASHFGVEPSDVKIYIVGSAKLGFSLSEKRLRTGEILARYRSFGPESDIDVAVLSPIIFDKVWWELSRYSNGVTCRPWKSKRFGDYLVCGWIRPDHFPTARLHHCDAWLECFDRLSARSSGRRKIRGALFNSLEHMRHYYIHAVRECHLAEALGNENGRNQ